mgnify:CR=1 FL=1
MGILLDPSNTTAATRRLSMKRQRHKPNPTAADLRTALEKEIAAQETAANIALEAFCKQRGVVLGVTVNYIGVRQSITISCVSQRRRELPPN